MSEQEDTSDDDDDEPEDAYASGPLADENWLAQYEAEREKKQELNDLASIVISTGDEEEACSVLPQVQLASFGRCVHKFPDFPSVSSFGYNRKA